MAYGVDQAVGQGIGHGVSQVDVGETVRIINYCLKQGVDMFDTAPGYGSAESILGGQRCSDWAHIITKVDKVTKAEIDQSVISGLEKGFHQSLTRLKTNRVYGLLVHKTEDLDKPGSEAMVEWMLSLKERGLVERIGVSVYEPDEVTRFYRQFDFDLIQMPVNLFDQRFLSSNLLPWLVSRQVEIHARSLFLKGLLLSRAPLRGLGRSINSQHSAYHNRLDQFGVDAFDVCMAFAEQVTDIDRWVLGFSSLDQLRYVLEWQNCIADQFALNQTGISWAGENWALDSVDLDPRNWPSC